MTCSWYLIFNLLSLVDWLVVMVAYHWMPRWFFWLIFVFAIVSDLGRGIRMKRLDGDE